MNAAHRLLRRACSHRLLVLLSLVPFAGSCSSRASGSYTTSGAATGSGSVEFRAAGVDWATGRPAVIFGVTTLAGSREYSYVIVAKPSDAAGGPFSTGASGKATLEYPSDSAAHMIEFGPSALSVVHSARSNATEDGLTEEKLVIQDKEVDLSLGRLILLDEWVIRGGWTQLATPLPGVTCAPEYLPDVTRSTLEALARTDSDLAEFLGQ